LDEDLEAEEILPSSDVLDLLETKKNEE